MLSLRRFPQRRPSVVGHYIHLSPRHLVLQLHMPAQILHRREELFANSAPRLTVMNLHMSGERVATSVGDAAYLALFAAAFNCGHEKDGDSELQHLNC